MKNPAVVPNCFVCRCEEIDEEELRAAIAAGARTINDVKRRTRAGMGLCQGIYCLERVGAILAEQTGVGLEQIAPMTSRPPARQLTLAALAGQQPDS
jgi:bacterioferritin-associated ferredoxin